MSKNKQVTSKPGATKEIKPKEKPLNGVLGFLTAKINKFADKEMMDFA